MARRVRQPSPPQVIVLGGPNGAGKTTASAGVLKDLLQIGEFVNADTIAAGLAGYAPERAAMAAGRIMIERLRELSQAHADFAFETTMASRSFAPFLRSLQADAGYEVTIVFMFLRSPELAIQRVRARVRRGGHSVPEDVIRRRYARGIQNFVRLYLPLATRFHVYDNSNMRRPKLAVLGDSETGKVTVRDRATWTRIQEIADGNTKDVI